MWNRNWDGEPKEKEEVNELLIAPMWNRNIDSENNSNPGQLSFNRTNVE